MMFHVEMRQVLVLLSIYGGITVWTKLWRDLRWMTKHFFHQEKSPTSIFCSTFNAKNDILLWWNYFSVPSLQSLNEVFATGFVSSLVLDSHKPTQKLPSARGWQTEQARFHNWDLSHSDAIQGCQKSSLSLLFARLCHKRHIHLTGPFNLKHGADTKQAFPRGPRPQRVPTFQTHTKAMFNTFFSLFFVRVLVKTGTQ